MREENDGDPYHPRSSTMTVARRGRFYLSDPAVKAFEDDDLAFRRMYGCPQP